MSQNGKLLHYLESHPNGITQLESFNTLGIARLSERIREIESLGYTISHTWEKTPSGARVVRYKLIGQLDLLSPARSVTQSLSAVPA